MKMRENFTAGWGLMPPLRESTWCSVRGPLSAGLAEEAGKGCQTMHFATGKKLTEQLLTMVQPGGYGAG